MSETLYESDGEMTQPCLEGNWRSRQARKYYKKYKVDVGRM